MYAYNTSSARKLTTYEPQETISRPVPQAVRLKVVDRKTHSLAFVNFKNIAMFFGVVACVCAVIFNQVQLNELNRQISKTDTEITKLETEFVQMQSSLDSTLSIKNVTKQAEQELGMQRIDQYQVIHVRIYEEDKIEIKDNPNPEGISETVETFASRVAGYFKGIFAEE